MKSLRELQVHGFYITRMTAKWRQLLGTALLLVACEPMTPRTDSGPCGDLPLCSSLEYGLNISGTGTSPADSNSGPYQIKQLGFRLLITPLRVFPRASCLPSTRPGYAYASSCLICAGESFLRVDSLYFTTDIQFMTKEILKAGSNLMAKPSPLGFDGGGVSFRVRQGFDTRFRDSVFEVRFSGTVDSIRKSGFATVHITNPALLFP